MTAATRRSSIDPASLHCTVAGGSWGLEVESRIDVVNPAT
jgi:hypothetical protein